MVHNHQIKIKMSNDCFEIQVGGIVSEFRFSDGRLERRFQADDPILNRWRTVDRDWIKAMSMQHPQLKNWLNEQGVELGEKTEME